MAAIAVEWTPGSAKAVRLATALADALPDSPRLLLIYGPPGVGKSELLRATADRFRERQPTAMVVETQGESLLNQLIEAATRDRLEEFRRADLVTIDDLHVLRKQSRTQSQVAVLFQSVLDRGARVVCATGSPREVPALAWAIRHTRDAETVRIPRATSRDIRRILAARARADGLNLTEASLDDLVARSKGDLRLGIGALARLRFDQRNPRP